VNKNRTEELYLSQGKRRQKECSLVAGMNPSASVAGGPQDMQARRHPPGGEIEESLETIGN
jgi:hypothetical protein